MTRYMTHELKWTQKELHDAVVRSDMTVPQRTSLLDYFHMLHRQFENKQYASLPQSSKTHTKDIYSAVLKILSRTGARLSGCTG